MRPRWIPLDLPEGKATEASGVRLVFQITRTRITGVGMPDPADASEVAPLPWHAVFPVLEIKWDDGQVPDVLFLEVTGEEPKVLWDHAEWLRHGGDELFLRYSPIQPKDRAGASGFVSLAKAAKEAVASADERRRDHVLHPDNRDWISYLWFFYDLDLRTNLGLLAEPESRWSPMERRLGSTIGTTGEYLVRCTKARLGDRNPPPASRAERECIEELSWLQRPIYLAGLGGHIGDVTVTQLNGFVLAEAFALFAAGCFYAGADLDKWNIGPDSIGYIHFAEYSLACRRLGIHPDFWAQVAPAQIETISLYFARYPAGGSVPTGECTKAVEPDVEAAINRAGQLRINQLETRYTQVIQAHGQILVDRMFSEDPINSQE